MAKAEQAVEGSEIEELVSNFPPPQSSGNQRKLENVKYVNDSESETMESNSLQGDSEEEQTDLSFYQPAIKVSQSKIQSNNSTCGKNRRKKKSARKGKACGKKEKTIRKSSNFSQGLESEEICPEKKQKQFDFFYKRTCFRIMGEWFKQKFRAFTEVNPDVDSDQQIATFLTKALNFKKKDLDEELMENYLTVLARSHRHNRKSSDLDFDTVRNTMYKYSQKVQTKFFSVPELKELFLLFSRSKDLKKFVEERYKEKEEAYSVRVLGYVALLEKEAIEL